MLGVESLAVSMCLTLHHNGDGSIRLYSNNALKLPEKCKNDVLISKNWHFRGFMSDRIGIQLNGKQCAVSACTLAELVTELGLEQRMHAIERNLEVVPKSQYDATALLEGDRIELVHMIGGG